MVNTKSKIAIIGPYPPPYGGISVHIQRILTYIPDNSYHFYNTQKLSNYGRKFYGIYKYFYLLVFPFTKYKIIHYHSTSKKVRLLLSFVAVFKPGVYLHLHGASFSDTITQKSITAFLLKKLIKHVNILASNEKIQDEINLYEPKSICCIDAFIPPKFNRDQYNEIIKNTVIPKNNHLICMVGWFAYYNKADLYGFDIMLKALHILKEKGNENVKIIASVNGIKDIECYNSFINEREKLGLNNDFLLITQDLEEIYPIYLHSDIFIRPTNTDGNSVSIKEALWFNCKVIASDAVVRPEETVLFKNRDALDLSLKIDLLLAENQNIKIEERIQHIENRNFNHPLLNGIYGLEK